MEKEKQILDSDESDTSQSFYDYSVTSASSLYDEESASSHYNTIETTAVRLALGLPGNYTDNSASSYITENYSTNSSTSEYSDGAQVEKSEDDTESSESDEPSPPKISSTSSSTQVDDLLSNVPTSIKALKRSTASSNSSGRVGYAEIYSGGCPKKPQQGSSSSNQIDANAFPLPAAQLRSMDIRLVEPFDRFFWSEQFFKIHESYLARLNTQASSSEDAELLDIYFRLSAHAQDFVSTAEKYAKIVISEKNLPFERKTVKPAREIGGVAGGEKYICQGIMLKFALDNRGIYGSDDSAIKSAGHDLNGLTLYYQCNIQGLYVPLMCAVDYKGYRVLCLSVLNISQETLRYGSSDGGRTIHADDADLNTKMEQAAAILNLAKHSVGSETSRKLVHSACDLEGHITPTDKRSVLLDFARVLPPEPPTKRNRQCIFYRMLRPELVRRSPVPLSSDSFSRFQSSDPNRHQLNQNTTAAWRNLSEVILPELAAHLKQREVNKGISSSPSVLTGSIASNMQNSSVKPNFDATSSAELVSEMHSRGINLRYLGFLRRLLVSGESKFWKTITSIEMVARVVKRGLSQILRKAMGDFMMPSEDLYRRIAVEYLNLVLGNSDASVAYWTNQLPQAIHLTFCYLLYESCEEDHEHEEMKLFTNCPLCCEMDLYKDTDRSALFARLTALLPLEFSPSCLRELSSSSQAFEEATPIEDTDVLSLTARVKNMPIIDKGKAFMLYRQAKQSARPDVAKTLLESAILKFNVALMRLPDNLTFHCAANSLYLLAKLQNDSKYAVTLLKRAFDAYRRVSAGFKNNGSCWFEAVLELERRMLLDPTREMQEFFAAELHSYLLLGKYSNAEDPETWLEEAELLIASSEKLARASAPQDLSYDFLLSRAAELLTAASTTTHRVKAMRQLATALLRRSILFRDADIVVPLTSGIIARSKMRGKILKRRAKVAFSSCISAASAADTANEIRQVVQESTKIIYKYDYASASRGNAVGSGNVAVPPFAKALAQPMLWQDLLVSINQDGKEIEVWDVRQLIRNPAEASTTQLPRALLAFRGSSNQANSTIRCALIEADHLFVADDSNTIKIWSLRAIRAFLREPGDRKNNSESNSSTSTEFQSVPLDALVRTLSGHDKPVICLALDPQSGHLYSSSKDGTIRAWALFGPSLEKHSAGKSIFKLKHNDLGATGDEEVKSLAAHGKRLYVCFSNRVLCLDTAGATSPATNIATIARVAKRAHSSIVQSSVSTGVLVLMTTANKVKIYSVQDLSKRASITLDDSFNRQMAVIGDLLLCISKKGFKIYRTSSGKLLASFDDAHRDSVTALVADPSTGVALSRSTDKSAIFWRTSSIDWIEAAEQQKQLSNSMVFASPASEIWDTTKLKSSLSSPLLPRAIGDAIAIGNDKIVLGLESSVALMSPVKLRLLSPEVSEHTNHISNLVPYAGNLVFSSAWDGSIRLWDCGDVAPVCKGFLQAHNQKIRRMIAYGARKLITGSKDKTVKIWDIDDVSPLKLKCYATLKGFGGSVLALLIIQDAPVDALKTDWLFTGSADGCIRLFDLRTMKCVLTLDAAPGRRILTLAARFTAHRKILVAGISTHYQNLRDFQQRGDAPHEVLVYDIANLPVVQMIGQYCTHTGGVTDLNFFDDYIVSLGRDNLTCFVDSFSLTQVHVYPQHAPPSFCLFAFGATYFGGYNSINIMKDPLMETLNSSLKEKEPLEATQNVVPASQSSSLDANLSRSIQQKNSKKKRQRRKS